MRRTFSILAYYSASLLSNMPQFSCIRDSFCVLSMHLLQKGKYGLLIVMPSFSCCEQCVLVCLEMGPFPSLSYGFMQKMKEEEVELVYMRELESL